MFIEDGSLLSQLRSIAAQDLKPPNRFNDADRAIPAETSQEIFQTLLQLGSKVFTDADTRWNLTEIVHDIHSFYGRSAKEELELFFYLDPHTVVGKRDLGYKRSDFDEQNKYRDSRLKRFDYPTNKQYVDQFLKKKGRLVAYVGGSITERKNRSFAHTIGLIVPFSFEYVSVYKPELYTNEIKVYQAGNPEESIRQLNAAIIRFISKGWDQHDVTYEPPTRDGSTS